MSAVAPIAEGLAVDVKVLVRSRWKEPVVCTLIRKRVETNDRGTPVVITDRYGRQFVDHHAFMTVQEADFLVNSKENQASDNAGEPRYFFPAGAPHPVPVEYLSEKYGEFTPPGLIGHGSGVDPRAAAAAARSKDEDKALIDEWTTNQAAGKPTAEITSTVSKTGATPIVLTAADAERIGEKTVPQDEE